MHPNIKNLNVYIVNLKKEKKRKKQSKKVLNELGFNNIHFIHPVDPDTAIKHPFFKNSNIRNKYIASHSLTYLNIMKHALKHDKNEYFIIAEDDIILRNKSLDNYNIINKIWNSAQKHNFDLLYFEYCNNICTLSPKLDKYLYKLYYPSCAAFIVYSKNICNKIINDYAVYGSTHEAIDLYYADKIKNKEIIGLGYPIFKQDSIFASALPGSVRSYSLYKNLINDDHPCSEKLLSIFILKISVIIIAIMIIYYYYRYRFIT